MQEIHHLLVVHYIYKCCIKLIQVKYKRLGITTVNIVFDKLGL